MTADLFGTIEETPDWEAHPQRISADGRRFVFVVGHIGYDAIHWIDEDGNEMPLNVPCSVGFLMGSRRFE
jgi:hypothetical protein